MPTLSLRKVRLALLASLAFAACGGNGLSRYQGIEPDELFEIATSEFADDDHDNAIEVLEQLLVAHGDWERIPEARLMLGDVHFDKGDFLTARSEYTRFLDRYAGHEGSAEASLGICKSLAALAPKPQRDQSYTEEAMTNCRNVVIDFAGLPQSVEAAEISNELRRTLAEKDYLNGDFYFRRKMFDSAIKYFEFVADLYPGTDYAPRALLGIVRSNEEIGYDDIADQARERLLAQYPDSEAAAEIRTDGSAS